MARHKNVRYRKLGAAGIITIDRAEKAGAYTDEMLDILTAFVLSAEEDHEIRALVIEGCKGFFCSGADLREVKTRTSLDALDLKSTKIFEALADISKPTIAAIDGPAMGGGLELTLACDLRIASDKSKFGFPEIYHGIIPAAGGTWRLAMLVGPSMAKKMVIFGDTLDAKTALHFGLIDEMVKPHELPGRISTLVSQVEKQDPIAVRLGKESINSAMSQYFGRSFARLAQGMLYGRQANATGGEG